MSRGRKLVRGTERIALITWGVRRMSCLMRLSISFSQLVFSTMKHLMNKCESVLLTRVDSEAERMEMMSELFDGNGFC